METIAGRHAGFFGGRVDIQLLLIRSSCLRRDWCKKPYGTEEPGPLAPTIRPVGRFRNMKKPLSCGPAFSISAWSCCTRWSTWATADPPTASRGRSWKGIRFGHPELERRAGRLPHERYVLLAPLALSKTQDDKGRVRWTLFGGSEQGPARAFWKGFWSRPGLRTARDALPWVFSVRLLNAAYGESLGTPSDLHRAGFRILLGIADRSLPYAEKNCLPSWIKPYLLSEGERLGRVKYLLTFRPFGKLPKNVQQAYLAGDLHLLPFPGSLVFWGAATFSSCGENCPWPCRFRCSTCFRDGKTPTVCGCRRPAGCTNRIPITPRPIPAGSAPQSVPADPSLGPHPSLRR